MPSQGDGGEAGIGQGHRFAGQVLHFPGQRQRLLRQPQGGRVVLALQVEVRQVGQGQHFLALGTGAARGGNGGLRGLQLVVSHPQHAGHDAVDRERLALGQHVTGLAGNGQPFAVDLQATLRLFGQHERIGQVAAGVGSQPGLAQAVSQAHGLLVQGHRHVQLAQGLLDAGLRFHKAHAQPVRHRVGQAGQGLGQQAVGAAGRPTAGHGARPQQASRGRRRRLAGAQLVQFLCGALHGRAVFGLQLVAASHQQGLHAVGGCQARQELGQTHQGTLGLAAQLAFDLGQAGGRRTLWRGHGAARCPQQHAAPHHQQSPAPVHRSFFGRWWADLNGRAGRGGHNPGP